MVLGEFSVLLSPDPPPRVTMCISSQLGSLSEAMGEKKPCDTELESGLALPPNREALSLRCDLRGHATVPAGREEAPLSPASTGRLGCPIEEASGPDTGSLWGMARREVTAPAWSPATGTRLAERAPLTLPGPGGWPDRAMGSGHTGDGD